MGQYLRIVFSNIQNNEPTWPLPPLTIYIDHIAIWDAGYVAITEPLDDGGAFYTPKIAIFPTPAPLRFIYKGVRGSSGTNYAILDANNSDFNAARQAGIYTGSYVGNYGETWNITHYGYDGTILFPSGEGGDVGLVFIEQTPLQQAGGESPNKAQNPVPADNASDIKLVTPQISWEAG